MACVNIKSKEFIKCCKDLNIHPTQLELIVHEYINIAGNEDSFPDNAYILSKLNSKTTFGTEEQITLWEKKYSNPIETNTIEEAYYIKQEISKYFDEESITLKHTNNDTWEIRVTKPTTDNNIITKPNNIYENKTKDIFNIIKNIKWEEIINKNKDIHGLTYKRNGKYYITLGKFYNDVINENIVQIDNLLSKVQFHIKQTLISKNINPDALKITIEKDGKLTIETKDKIAKNQQRLLTAKSIETTLNFLETKIPGLSHKVVRENSPFLHKLNINPSTRAFFKDGIVYLIEGRFNEDIAIEECLHPFINVLYKENKDLFDLLLEAAKEDFPTLYEEIKNSYDEQSIDKELVTQTLSRYLRNELQNQEEKSKWETLKDKFYNFIKDLFGSIQIKEIKSNTTFEELSLIILSEDGIFNIDLLGFEYNLENTKENFDTDILKSDITFTQHNLLISQQTKNLNDNDLGLTLTEIRLIADECVYWINEAISNYLNNPEEIFNLYKFQKLRTLNEEGNWTEEAKNKDIDKINSMSRIELVQFLGIDNLMDLCRETLFENNPVLFDDNATTKLQKQAALFRDNFNGLMTIATSTWTSVEKFSIQYNPELNNFGVSEELNVDLDNFNNSNDLDEIRENGDNTRENWLIDRRTEDVLESMSLVVRNELLKCYIIIGYDSQGNPIYQTNKFGVRQRINTREATSKLLNWFKGSISYDDMINRLEEKLSRDNNNIPTKNIWLTQLLDKLKIVEGRPNPNSNFQSQFFSTLNKPFLAYTIVIKEKNGTFRNVEINKTPALKEAIDSVITQYKIETHPLFNQGKDVNKQNLLLFTDIVNDLINTFYKDNKYLKLEELNQEQKDKLLNLIIGATNYLGYYTTPELIKDALESNKNIQSMIHALSYISKSLNVEADNKNYNPFNNKNNPNGIYGNLKTFLTPITNLLEDAAISSFYDNGKMYQSYVVPSYGIKLMNKFHLEGTAFDDFIIEEFGTTEWFHIGNDIETGWRNEWLRQLVSMSSEDRKKVFQHKVLLSFNKHNYMRTMGDTEYALSIFTEYFTNKDNIAFYRMPIMSNKPTSEFISFYKYTGDFSEGTVSQAKQTLIDGYYKIFLQELSRIQTCRIREQEGITKDDPRFIKNFDKNGKQFMFLDFLNEYLKNENSELGKLIDDKLEGKQIDENQLNTLVKQEIATKLDEKATQILKQWKNQGIFEAIKISGLVDKKDTTKIENAIREFVWNDTFAAINILQLTITDIAYYKDAEDLQKRLALIHAPGIRANINATDYNGNRVSDGKSRTIYLTDFENIKSNIIENVTEVFDRKIESANEDLKAAYIALRDSVVKMFENDINLADAQAFCSPTALRKKMFMFGRWDARKEEMYNKLREGNYNFGELQEAFSQPLKPFVYSQVNISSLVEAPIKNLKVGIQNKNSEYLLIMADALLRNEKTSKPNLLRVLYNIMEESHYDSNGNYKLNGIDTIQFESAVKAGLYGRIDLRPFSNLYDKFIKYDNPLDAEKAAKDMLISVLYNQGDKTKDYNLIYVKEFLYEDYSILQEVPEHFKNHELAHGSLTRYIIPSDLETVDNQGNPVIYDYFDPNSTNPDKIERKTATELKTEYENTIAENIEHSINELKKELYLTEEHIGDYKALNIAISKILQREILSSPRYGIDLLQACSLNEDGEFNIPKGDPIQSKRIEQLLNSIIKNRINKQKIAGGPVVQVTNFGTSKQLNIRFNTKKGDILKTEAEWELNKGNYTSYKDYIKENQAGIVYWEVFVSLPNNDIFNKFADANGNVDIKAIEKTEPDLLKMIGYRIPTEAKYSIIPMKIVGFLPREAGEGIMMPADVTLTTGSDFDVDKMYLMIKDLQISTRKDDEIKNALVEKLKTSSVFESKPTAYIKEQVRMYLNNPLRMKNMDKEMQTIDIAYRNIAYYVTPPTQGVAYRNNKIIDMTYAVLTHETTADKSLNPGGFNQLKKSGYMIQAKRLNPKLSLSELKNMSVDELKNLCYTDKNLCYIDTHIQFYKQNSVAGLILGMFAVQKVAHAVLESDGLRLDIQSICLLPEEVVKDVNGNPIKDSEGNTIAKPTMFEVTDMMFGDTMEIDKKYDIDGINLIGKTLGSLVAASADAVKDPVLNLMNINSNTTGVLTTLLRLGMPWDNAALFLSQKIITDVLTEFNNRNLLKFTKLADVIEEHVKKLSETYNFEDSIINEEPLSMEELEEGLITDDPRIQYKTLVALQYFYKIANAAKGLTTATRFNSISNAVGPLIIDNIMMEYKMEKFSPYILDKNKNSLSTEETNGMERIFNMHPILNQFVLTISLASNYMFSDMPANSKLFRAILNNLSNFGNLQSIIFGDRKLLSKLSDFFQSYILIASNSINDMCEVININVENKLDYFINQFPKDFVINKIKERYSDNPFILAIKLDTNKNNELVLKVETIGLDINQKEKLSCGWADLHKANPKLSTSLFLYNFFRTGIGFNPKTFISLLPYSVKVSKEFKSYIDTYKKLPYINTNIFIDQFVRNNWTENKLVANVSNLKYKLQDNNLITNLSDYNKFKNNFYIKIKLNNEYILFKQVGIDTFNSIITYERVDALGNNGECLEISTSIIDNKEFKTQDIIIEDSTQESLELETSVLEENTLLTIEYTENELENLLVSIFTTSINNTIDKANQAIENFRSKTNKQEYSVGMKKFINKRLQELNIENNESLVEDLFKKLC